MVWRAACKVRAKGITITRYVLWGSRPEFRSARAVQELLEVIHSDVAGPMEIPSLSGSHYYVTFIDNRSRRMFMYFLKTTSGEEILGRLKQFQAQAECQCERKIKIMVRSILIMDFKDSITQSSSTGWQNVPMGRLRSSCCLKHTFRNPWVEITAVAVFLVNQFPTRGHGLIGKKPDISHVSVFGTKAMLQVPKQNRRKWDPKSGPCVLTGFKEETKGYRLYDPSTK